MWQAFQAGGQQASGGQIVCDDADQVERRAAVGMQLAVVSEPLPDETRQRQALAVFLARAQAAEIAHIVHLAVDPQRPDCTVAHSHQAARLRLAYYHGLVEWAFKACGEEVIGFALEGERDRARER